MADNSIWCEKYRPQTLKDLVGNQSILDALLTYSKHKMIPNMLMTGSPGCGKTSAVQSLANECILPDGEYLELNTSDERGVEMIRNKLKLFSGKRLRESSASPTTSRIVFLDEADGMTNQAQLGLKALMDNYSGKVTFILSCNNVLCLHESVVTRCVTFHFEPIPTDVVCKKMEEIILVEKVKITSKEIRAIAEEVSGDLRSAINTLQMRSLEHGAKSSIRGTTLVTDSKVEWLLNTKRTCPEAYRKATIECLHLQSRCEDQLGIDKLLELLGKESKVSPDLIRGLSKIMFGGECEMGTDPIMSVAKLFAILRCF